MVPPAAPVTPTATVTEVGAPEPLTVPGADDRPPRSGARVVQRTELFARLERGTAARVTLVAAPAGSGKTLLVRSWAAWRGERPTAWVAVERGERDGQRFWGELVRALRAAAPEDLDRGPQPSPVFDGPALTRRLLAQLAELSHPLVLVVDDLHELVEPSLLEQFRYFLDHLPAALHVVLISRRDPHLGLHRSRLAGELAELRSADLRFTLEETRQLLSDVGSTLSDQGVARLHERTEGWVAGVRLAALTLATHPDPERFVAAFSGSERTVAEYLLAEVLDSQPPRVRRLLVRTALLERVNGELADLLTGGSGAEHDLRQLAEAGGFVVALDEEGSWFRFHRLFADLLALELRHTEADQVPRLHLLASGWFAEHDQLLEAITHAQAGGDRERAAGLLSEHYFSLTLDGRQESAHALLADFAPVPATVLAPEILSVLAAEELVAGSLERADTYLDLARRGAAEVPEDRRRRFDSALLVNRLTLARRRGDFRSVLAETAPATHPDEPVDGRDLVRHNDVRALTLMNLGIVEVWTGSLDAGARHLEAAGRLAEQIGRPYLQVGCLAHWAYASSWRSFTHAREAAQEALDLAEHHGWGADPVVGPALITLGGTTVLTGRLEESELHLARAQTTLRLDLEPALGLLLHMAYGLLHSARGRSAAALASYRQAELLGPLLVSGSPLTIQLRCSTMGALLATGEHALVRQALAELTASERTTGEAREVVAGLALAEGDPATAVRVLAPTLDGTAQVHHLLVVVRSLLLEAHARTALGETTAAEDALERALELAEPDMVVLPFLLAPSRELLARHPHSRTAHGAFLADVRDASDASDAAAGPEGRRAPLVEELTDAELRVLRFLPTNLPAGAIAQEIYVSVNTVKTHMRHIYAKLGTHNRVGAVERARELGLLGRSTRLR